jgi:hypothetical protein
VMITGAVTVGTLGGGAVAGVAGRGGQIATQGLMQTARSGAIIGGTEAGLTSAAQNIDDVNRGAITKEEGIKRVVGDTALGSTVGAVTAGVGQKLGSGARALTRKADDAAAKINQHLDDQITAKLDLADRLEQSLPGGRYNSPNFPGRAFNMSGAGGKNNRQIRQQVSDLREEASQLRLRRNQQNAHQTNHGGQKGSKDLTNVRQVGRDAGIPSKMQKKFGKYVERRMRNPHERPDTTGYDALKELANDFLLENGLAR